MPGRPHRARGGRRPAIDGREQHQDWLSLVEIDGPYLTLPVLSQNWPTLDAIDAETMARLRDVHAHLDDKPRAWVEFVVEDLLEWSGAVSWAPSPYLWTHPGFGVAVVPDFALIDADQPVLLGYLAEQGDDPRGRVLGDDWAATRTDRAAAACRALGVPFALVTNGRLWSLVWAPRQAVTTVVTFDTMPWTDSADRIVVRAFRSQLRRSRFAGVPEAERLDPLLRRSVESQEDITESLGIGVRHAVEQLVEAIGRWDAREAATGRPGLGEASPPEVYRGAVTVLMRLMFLFFAEERGLLPADDELYAAGYGVSGLCRRLERRAETDSEESLEHATGAWLQVLATSVAVHRGVGSARMPLPAYDGSLFDPGPHPWLSAVSLDDRTMLHVLRAVQYVQIGRERRQVSFRTLEVEQIGYVYEGLLGYDARRAEQWVLGLVGKRGLEEEVPLPDLEGRRARRVDSTTGALDQAGLAADLAEAYRSSGIGSAKRLATLLATPDGAERGRRLSRLLAVTEGDRALAERILPFFGLLRPDLRGLPTVYPAGALYVTGSAARAKSGTHYTPRELADEVTRTALLPLVCGTPGPLDTDDQHRWAPRSSADLLALKVADIAMGSGAFLVAACRFLADHLVRAWARESDADAADHLAKRAADEAPLRVDGAVPEVVTRARRLVIEHCLYGVDVNPTAVEMAKLSLWLVSMDRHRPFTFLDDRLLAGDSLLGIAGLDQLEWLHLDPAAGRRIHGRWERDPIPGVRSLVADLASERSAVADLPGESLDQLATKRERLAAVDRLRWRADLLADVLVASSLAQSPGGQRMLKINSKNLAALVPDLIDQPADAAAVAEARQMVRAWLGFDLPDGADPRVPFHWPLRFPEVFSSGGFDAIIGNPPFLGDKKITGALGTVYRDYLLHGIGRSVRGSADLVAYFVLRAHELLNSRGQTGLLATNTLAQGDTREVGLDRLADRGVTIKAAIKSEPWPSRSAVLEYCAVWTSRSPIAEGVDRVLDRRPVRSITSGLDAGSRVGGQPHRLAENAGVAFIGSFVLGMGFTMTPDHATALIDTDPRNAEVLFPYLNGQDLNSRPDCSASRWVINFHDWSEERAASYPVPFGQVARAVKPERQRRKPSGAFALRTPLPQRYWHYADKRPALTALLHLLDRCIAITLVSKVVMPVMVPTGQVFAHVLGVFASDDPALLALLSSAPHYWWAIQHASTLETRIRYTPTDVFETFPRPEPNETLRTLGDRLDRERRDLMLARSAGLTATYNLVHDPGCADPDIFALRSLHREIDLAAFAAYGWTDLAPVHDHVETRQGIRWSVDPVTRQEMLDRLLELNHEWHAAEQSSGATAEAEGTLF